MTESPHRRLLSIALLALHLRQSTAESPPPPDSYGYNCTSNRTIYPCQAYAFYRAGLEPSLLDLPSIGDLFGVSRLTIARASNLTASAPLSSGDPLLIPLACSCAAASNKSYAAVDYQIAAGDTFYAVSTYKFGNLTAYPAVEVANPALVPTDLDIGVEVVFPIFRQCPNPGAGAKSFVTYVFQPSDTFASVASRFGTGVQSLAAVNGQEGSVQPFSTILVPVSRVPPPFTLKNESHRTPTPPPAPAVERKSEGEKKGVIAGLAIGLGVLGILWLMTLLLVGWLWRGGGRRRRRWGELEEKGGGEQRPIFSDEKLMTDISEWLDRYKVYRIEELREATAGFDGSRLIQGSVYKGIVDGEVFAVKKMKWNAADELKILQKVNHTNLVKLEGFCIEPDAGACYLVYEYVPNGSLDSWLRDPARSRRLDWRCRLRIALDLANGLQYIHEHTWPRVVHKDVKSSNVLLDARLRAKIANFGLARTGLNAVTTHIVGTQGYVAPEYLTDGLVTTRMDVFAYGVVLLELVSGRPAVGEGGEMLWVEADRVLSGAAKDGRAVMGWVDPVLVGGSGAGDEERSFSVEGVGSVVSIAKGCLHRDPAKRPSMVDVVYTLSKAHDDLFSDFSEEGMAVGTGELVAPR